MFYRISFVVLSLLSGVSFAGVSVTDYKPIDLSIHDLSTALGIRCYGGEFTTNEVFNYAKLRMVFYKDGKLKAVKEIGMAFKTGSSHKVGQVSIKIIDLDHLSIQKAPKNSYRIHYTISLDGSITSGFRDIGKEIFDFSGGSALQVLCHGNDDVPNPLFYAMGSHGDRWNGFDDLERVIKANKKADIMVACLDFTE